MDKLPVKLGKSPIVETVLEIRFATTFPEDAVFGVIYQTLLPRFTDFRPIPQAILKIPQEIRRLDKSMYYLPHYQLVCGNKSIGVGPHSIIFSNRNAYMGWTAYKEFVNSAIDLIFKGNIVQNIERISLRYINVLQQTLFDTTKLNISLYDDVTEKNDVVTLRVENSIDENNTLVFQLNNNVQVSIDGGHAQKASMIDIDVIQSCQIANVADSDSSVIAPVVEQLHGIEKRAFFSLLRDDYLNQLKPVYEEAEI